MEPNRSANKLFLDSIVKYWPIIIGVITVITIINGLQTKVTALQDQFYSLQPKVELIDTNYNVLSKDLAGINAKMDILLKKSDL